MSLNKPSLSELQAIVQAAVMGGSADAALALVSGNSRTTREVLFGVYLHAYLARLVGVVVGDYPHLQRHMGDDAFDAMARAYLEAHPSHNPNARWVSHRLPEFLAERYGEQPELAEIAALERALSDAFDAPDDNVLDLAQLAQHPAEVWGQLRFVPHRSCALLDETTNAFQIWQALKNEQEAPPVQALPGRQTLLVWRDQAMPKVRILGAEEAMMWKEALGGATFGRLCELLAVFDDPATAPVRAAQYLQGWMASGALSEARLDDGRLRA